jgi:hypothetical protein
MRVVLAGIHTSSQTNFTTIRLRSDPLPNNNLATKRTKDTNYFGILCFFVFFVAKVCVSVFSYPFASLFMLKNTSPESGLG